MVTVGKGEVDGPWQMGGLDGGDAISPQLPLAGGKPVAVVGQPSQIMLLPP
jgi:hypothetical protein